MAISLLRPVGAEPDYSAAARVAYRAARALGLNNYTLQLNLGTCHQALGEPDEAVGAAREALRLQPGDAVAQYNEAARQFPTRVLARLFGFGPAGPL